MLVRSVMPSGRIGRASGQSPRRSPLLWKKFASQTGMMAEKRAIEKRASRKLSEWRMSRNLAADLCCRRGRMRADRLADE